MDHYNLKTEIAFLLCILCFVSACTLSNSKLERDNGYIDIKLGSSHDNFLRNFQNKCIKANNLLDDEDETTYKITEEKFSKYEDCTVDEIKVHFYKDLLNTISISFRGNSTATCFLKKLEEKYGKLPEAENIFGKCKSLKSKTIELTYMYDKKTQAGSVILRKILRSL